MLNAFTAGQVNWGNDNYAEGCIFNGALGEKLAVMPVDREDCDTLCTTNNTCTHYNWVPEGRLGTCILRTGLAQKSDSSKTVELKNVCGIKSIRWEKDNWATKCDFTTKSTLRMMETDPDKCGPTCFNDDDCTHFTYSNLTRKCRLMTGDISKDKALVTLDQEMICGVAILDSIEWQVGNYAIFCEFKGKDFSSKPTKPEECGPECQASARCTHFTWIKGICNLKEGNVKKEDALYTRNKNYVCGFIEGRNMG